LFGADKREKEGEENASLANSLSFSFLASMNHVGIEQTKGKKRKERRKQLKFTRAVEQRWVRGDREGDGKKKKKKKNARERKQARVCAREKGKNKQRKMQREARGQKG